MHEDNYTELPVGVWELLACCLDRMDDVWALSATCRSAIAVRTSPLFAAKWLLRHKTAQQAFITALNKLSGRPLLLRETVHLLLKSGADPNARVALLPPLPTYEDPCVALHAAASASDVELVAILLQAGADPNAEDPWGRTALHWARTAPVVQALVQAGANTEISCANACTPLHLACQFGNVEQVEALVAAGAAVHAKAIKGDTPLHWLARRGSSAACDVADALVKALVQGGADVNASNLDLEKPLHLAAARRNMQLIAVLMQHGGKPWLVSASGRSAYEVPRDVEFEKAMRQLEADLKSRCSTS